MITADDDTIAAFWTECRAVVDGLPDAAPEAWAFGATPEHADQLLALVLSGTKTATSSALWDFEADGEDIPEVGSWNIILDGSGRPTALVQTVGITIVPFEDVTAAHAHAEGEDDRSLASWREEHERYWRRYSTSTKEFDRRMPIVCEDLRLVHARGARDIDPVPQPA